MLTPSTCGTLHFMEPLRTRTDANPRKSALGLKFVAKCLNPLRFDGLEGLRSFVRALLKDRVSIHRFPETSSLSCRKPQWRSNFRSHMSSLHILVRIGTVVLLKPSEAEMLQRERAPLGVSLAQNRHTSGGPAIKSRTAAPTLDKESPDDSYLNLSEVLSCAGAAAEPVPAHHISVAGAVAEFEKRSWWQVLVPRRRAVLTQFVESLLSSDEDPHAIAAAIRAIAGCPVRQRPSHARCPAREARKPTLSNPAALPASGDPLLPPGTKHTHHIV